MPAMIEASLCRGCIDQLMPMAARGMMERRRAWGFSYPGCFSCAIATGGRVTPLSGHSCRLTLGRLRLKQGVQGILANQPLLADFDRRELTSLNFPSDRIRLHAQDFRRFSRGVEFRFAHID